MTENVGTSSNFHVSPTFDANDYRENITQDEPIDPVNIDDHDLPNYGSHSSSNSDDLPNAEESGDNVPFEASSSDDKFLMHNRSPRPMSMSLFSNHEIPYLDHLPDGPDILGDTHGCLDYSRFFRIIEKSHSVTHSSTITNKGKTYLRCRHICIMTMVGFDQIGYQAWEHMAQEFSVRNYKKANSGQFNPLSSQKY
ncbi:hypothetical protein KY290_011740 [Solanum tuberosum]|uniref:Uncharacterized protein n=1 Tax=Solanum tuberosum TaxID=4113 RepID=A0ABQ7W1J6_SOLTU|nr:hypothetical protein KY289_011722 [Solanum tuberosum]KAH0735505.1 hypothetical protein KY285_011212 [Solanum tuberosum]KAH0774603.1 hypothetical protein KY290_011740 [Solanum tuberosum]